MLRALYQYSTLTQPLESKCEKVRNLHSDDCQGIYVSSLYVYKCYVHQLQTSRKGYNIAESKIWKTGRGQECRRLYANIADECWKISIWPQGSQPVG
jgi:hypothetical protein